MDAAASTIVLLAKIHHFSRARKFDDRLSEAYLKFDSWCHEHGKTTSIEEFSKDSFGMQKPLGPEMNMFSWYMWIPKQFPDTCRG